MTSDIKVQDICNFTTEFSAERKKINAILTTFSADFCDMSVLFTEQNSVTFISCMPLLSVAA